MRSFPGIGKKIPAGLLVLGLFLLNACAHVYTKSGAYYRVKKGDTLSSIAQRYRTSLQELAEVNNIEHENDLRPGSSIFIPHMSPSAFSSIMRRHGVTAKSEGKSKKGESKAKAERGQKEEKESKAVAVETKELGESEGKIHVEHGKFSWPIDGELSSLFGMRHGRRHDGVDIRAPIGTAVRSAADGQVVYAKRMRGYGNLILVRHDDDFFTVYAHNSVNLVKEGAKIRKGQVIAKVGQTGRATGPHVHFEVREGARARNPLFFLPKTMYAEKAKERGVTAYGGPEGEDGGEAEAENP